MKRVAKKHHIHNLKRTSFNLTTVQHKLEKLNNSLQTHTAMCSPTVRAGAFPRSTSSCEITTSSRTASSSCLATQRTWRRRPNTVASKKPTTLGGMRERYDHDLGPRQGRDGSGRIRYDIILINLLAHHDSCKLSRQGQNGNAELSCTLE